MASTILVLSPHLDDAALAVGAGIAARGARGDQVTVVTLMTADEPPEPPSPVARTLYRAWTAAVRELPATAPTTREPSSQDPSARRPWSAESSPPQVSSPEARDDRATPHPPPRGRIARPREEDRRAMARLGARAHHADLPDALFRRDERGRALYSRFRHLFAAPAAGDRAIRDQLAHAVTSVIAAAAQDAGGSELLEVWAPLGIGGHVDHRLVRAAADALHSSAPPSDLRSAAATRQTPRLRYYEDAPYRASWRGRLDRWRLLRPRERWHAEPLVADPAAAEAKVAALLAYGSQVGPLFGSADRLRSAVLQDLGRGGEQLWEMR
jgi:LmbE family N-acetylglucosaminyl deacetylase